MRFLDSAIKRWIAPYVEVADSGRPPVFIRGSDGVAEHVHVKCEALEAACLRTANTLELPFTLSMFYVAHAQLSIPWTLSGPIELIVEDVHIVLKQPDPSLDRRAVHVREIREEANVTAEVDQLVGVYSNLTHSRVMLARSVRRSPTSHGSSRPRPGA